MPQLDVLSQPCPHAPPPSPSLCQECLVQQVRSQLRALLPAAHRHSLRWHSRARTRSDHSEVRRHRQAPAFLSEHEQRLVGAAQERRRRLYRLVIGLDLRKQTSSSGRTQCSGCDNSRKVSMLMPCRKTGTGGVMQAYAGVRRTGAGVQSPAPMSSFRCRQSPSCPSA